MVFLGKGIAPSNGSDRTFVCVNPAKSSAASSGGGQYHYYDYYSLLLWLLLWWSRSSSGSSWEKTKLKVDHVPIRTMVKMTLRNRKVSFSSSVRPRRWEFAPPRPGKEINIGGQSQPVGGHKNNRRRMQLGRILVLRRHNWLASLIIIHQPPWIP
jgi:hypothetical protein